MVKTEKHFMLLLAYRVERNKSQAQKAIYYCTNKQLSFGRHIVPFTQELIDLGYIKRTNPNSSHKQGHNHIITLEGEKAINEYSMQIDSISRPQPEFGF